MPTSNKVERPSVNTLDTIDRHAGLRICRVILYAVHVPNTLRYTLLFDLPDLAILASRRVARALAAAI